MDVFRINPAFLLLVVSSLTATAGTCVLEGSTERSLPPGCFAPSVGMDLETRTGICVRGVAEDLCPFETRVGGSDWGIPMRLTTRPLGLFLMIK